MKHIIIFFCFIFSSLSYAEQKQSFGELELHYNTFESTFLLPKIAKQYDFIRSKGRGLLNVAVIKPSPNKSELPQSIPAIVTGTVTNLIGQIVKLDFVTIDEGNAIYYIAAFTKTDDEILRFKVNAKLSADSAPMAVKFEKHVYVDR